MSLWNNARFKFGEMITGPSALQLIRQAGLLNITRDPLVVLDNACGSGIVASLLHETLEGSVKERLELTCGDVSQDMVNVVQQRITDGGWKWATAQIVDAHNTGLSDSYFSHVVTSMGVMLMRDSKAAVKEIFRILRPGGVCALSTWQASGWLSDIPLALATIPGTPPFPDPDTLSMALSHGARWHNTSYVEQQLAEHGFKDVKVEVLTSLAFVDDAAAYAEMLSPMVTWFTTVVWNSEDCERYGRLIKPTLLKYATEKYGENQRIEWEMAAILATALKP